MHYKEYFQIGVKATSRYHQKLEKSSLNIWSLSFIIHLNLFQTKTSLILYNKSFHLFDVFLPYKIILSFLLAVVITYIARIWLTITSQLSSLIASLISKSASASCNLSNKRLQTTLANGVALHKERTYERETAKGRLQIHRLISHKPIYIMSI